jgi:hypothetical protein
MKPWYEVKLLMLKPYEILILSELLILSAILRKHRSPMRRYL